MLNGSSTIREMLLELRKLSPSGCAVGLHIRMTAPRILYQTYSPEWMRYYAEHRMLLVDPTVAWAMANTGTIRWSDLADQDAGGVFEAAARFGLVHGVLVATGDAKSKSLGNFARDDRPFTDAEMARFTELVETLHIRTADESKLSPQDLDALSEFSTA